MTILVTGSSGFVGLNLLEQLLAAGESVVGFGLDPPPAMACATLDALPGSRRHISGDVRDAAAVRAAVRESGASGVIHGAVITAGWEREQRDAPSIVAANVLGTVNVLQASLDHAVERFVYLSSASVYGANASAQPRLSETSTPPLPQSMYAVTKHAAEGISRRYGSLGDLQVVAARLSAVYGRWEYDTGVRDTLSPPFLLFGAAQRGESVVLPDRNQRDWIYAPDVARAVISLLQANALAHDLYNVSTGTTFGLTEWAEPLQGIFPAFSCRVAREGEQCDAAYVTDSRSPLDIRRLVEDTGFAPQFGPEQALTDYVAWHRDHPTTS